MLCIELRHLVEPCNNTTQINMSVGLCNHSSLMLPARLNLTLRLTRSGTKLAESQAASQAADSQTVTQPDCDLTPTDIKPLGNTTLQAFSS